MAQRTIGEIYNVLITEKESLSNLDELLESSSSSAITPYQRVLDDVNSKSKVSKWRLYYWVVAVGMWVHETLWYAFKTEVEQIIASAIPGTLPWYRKISLEFQYGDDLSYIDNKFVYPVIDIDKQIVKRAASVETGGILYIKTATLDGAGLPIPLDTPTHDSFKAYIGQRKYAGTKVQFINESADLLKVGYDIYYDPLVLAADGSLISDSAVFPVENGINDFLEVLPFNGDMLLSSFDDSIQQSVGVADFNRNVVQAKIAGGAYIDVDVKHSTNAGYIKIDPAFPLSTQLNYIANV